MKLTAGAQEGVPAMDQSRCRPDVRGDQTSSHPWSSPGRQRAEYSSMWELHESPPKGDKVDLFFSDLDRSGTMTSPRRETYALKTADKSFCIPL
ncbi:hypothetical protein NDU88_010352 [Pleurodeles waltl]|uniref:Uncharacterized protein n=1 Tax=Pleurodeles waltl TaxID=8319 RepID=A0AAV7PXN8_PLEWA|nr:hypothetical protein NDU88_010352 [Pleurodeles waltl]